MIAIRSRLWQILHLTPRGAIEALMVALSLILAAPTTRSLIIGGAIAAAGELVRLWTAGYPELTLRRGPYRWVRHPHILGSILLFLGMALATANIYAMIITVLLLPLAYRGRFRHGEAAWRHLLGPWSASQEDAVPALIPRLWPASVSLDSGRHQINKHRNSIGFSLERGLLRGRHRELDTLLAVVVVGATLYGVARLSDAAALHGWILAGLTLLLLVRVIYYRLR